ncbi:MAG: hypothetical protein KDE27_08880, partial [Planctomycetes bacterium]|nr:hypothetical protein [Planctomycetota bacterium]
AFPQRAEKVLALLSAMRGGAVNGGDNARFHRRMHGVGPRYRLIVDLFEQRARALGLQPPPAEPGTAVPAAADGGFTEPGFSPPAAATPFRRPHRQGSLFEDLAGGGEP